MPANEIQYGGDHYKGADYQHWDFVTDVRLGYLLGVASKYVSRWRKKDGIVDLQKADHYLDKAAEVGVQGSSVAQRHTFFWRFVIANDLTLLEAEAVYFTMEGQLPQAKDAVRRLLIQASQGSRTGESTPVQLPT